MPNIKLNIQINPQLSSLSCQLIPSCVFPHPCRNRKRQFRVSFAPTVNHTHRPPTAALRVCNLIMDQHSSRHAVMDSGASSHFFPTTYKGGDEQIDPVGVQVRTANNGVICSKLTDTIPFPILPPEARRCHKFDNISHPLLSVGKLCDAGYHVHFDSHHVYILSPNPTGDIILQGHRDPLSILYVLSFNQQLPHLHPHQFSRVKSSQPIVKSP